MSRYSFAVLVMLITSFSASSQVFQSPHFLDWSQEPNYEGVTGYDENPYDSKRKHYAAIKLNADQFQIQSIETFDSLWNNLGNPEYINRPIFPNGGDPYDLESNGNFGAVWKAAHEGSNLYILIKYYDLNEIADPYSRQIRIFTQPTDITRHEPTYQAGVQNNDMTQKNLAYGRFIELGGNSFDIYQGMINDSFIMQGITGEWGFNSVGYLSVIELNHYWDEDEKIIRGMIILPFDGALAYPVDPYFPEGDQVPLTEGSIIAFDIQGLGCNNPDWEFENCFNYAWSADNYMVDYSNYYTGHLEVLLEKKYNLLINTEPLEGGIAIGDGDYFQGQTVNISATPNEGWIFQKWTDDDQMISILANHTFAMPAEDLTLTAHFSDKVPEINYEPVSIDQALISGETVIQNMVISNTGDNESELIVQISLLSGKQQDPTYWLTFDPKILQLGPDESSGIEIGFNADNLIEGTYVDTLLLLSNDPEMLRIKVPIILSVTGIPAINLSQNELDFGYLGTGATHTMQLIVSNPGTADLVIEDIEVDNSLFSFSLEESIISPNSNQVCKITFTSSGLGEFDGFLTIKNNSADHPELTIPLFAKVIDLTINFIVSDDEGVLIEDAEVIIKKGDQIIASGITNSNGEAIFNTLYSGDFSYEITKKNIETSSGTFTLDQSSVTIPVTITYVPPLLLWADFIIDWENEPENALVKGYHNNPYDEKRRYYTAYKLQGDYYENFTQESFDLLWDVAGEAENIDRHISGSDLFNFDNQFTLGAQWKAIHNGLNLYVLLKMTDTDQVTSQNNTASFDVMIQPGEIFRYEPNFTYGLENENLIMKNMAYGRYIELGGGLTWMWNDTPHNFIAISGINFAGEINEPNSLGLRQQSHYWNRNGGNINAILVLDFDQALSYPSDPRDIWGERVGMKENRTTSFDVKYTAYINNLFTEYFWSSESYNCYASNYYSGHLYISSEDLTATPKVLTLASNPSEGGTSSGEGTFDWGDEITITATPADGWKFVNWTKNGTVISRENPYIFTLYFDTELTANFTDEWPEISVLPESIEEALDTGDSIEKEIIITNNGNIPLDFSISIESIVPGNKNQDHLKSENLIDTSIPQKGEKDLRVGAPVDKAYGGPDDFGYRWSDSDNPNGPAFNWNSIENTGTLLSSVSGCDDCYQAVDLHFDFPFYGINYNRIYVDANGHIGFINGWSSYWNQELPTFNAPPGIIAGYWMDLCPGCNINGKVFFQNFDNVAIIQYQDVPLLSGSGSVTFQIQLFRSGEIRLLYQTVPTYHYYYTIGIQNPNRDMGLTVAFNTPYLKNNHAIRIASTPNWISHDLHSGTLAPGENQTITLLLDATDLADGIYESSLIIQSNDPESYLVIVPVTLDVTGYPAIEISDHTIDFGISGLGHQVQFPLTITNPGGAALEITQIEVDNPGFSIPYAELEIPPFESRILQVSFLGNEEITFEGVLTFNTNVDNQENFSIPLKAEVLKLDVLFTIKHNDEVLQGATITIKQANNSIYTGITDESGFLLVENLYPGTFSHLITKDNFRNEEGTFVITDQSLEISIAMTEQFVRFYIASDDTLFEAGVNDIIPLQIEASGFTGVYYTIYISSNGYWDYVTSGNFNQANSASINYNYQLDPFINSGTYDFFIYYDTYEPYSYGQIYTREIEVINHNELIEITNPQSYDTYTVGSSAYIYWKSINVSTVNISYSIDNENTWELIESNIYSEDSYYGYAQNYFYWSIPSDLIVEDKQCKIRIESSSNADIFGISDAFTLRAAPLIILYPTTDTEIYVGERLNLRLDMKRSSWLYFDVLDEASNYYLGLSSEYRNVGIQELSFTQTQNLKPGKNRISVYHSYESVSCMSESFNVLPATGLHGVSYVIDMSNAKINGTTDFNPEDNDVYISGSFQDKWPKPGSADRYKLTHIGSKKFQVKLNTPPGEILYSFYIVPKNGAPTWEHGENDTINCRIATINKAMELYHVWKNYPVYELKLEVAPPEAGLAFGGGFRASGHFTSISTIPHSNYKFINWTSGNQQIISDSPELEFRMPPGNVTYTANYVYALNAGAFEHPGTYMYPNPARDKVRIISSLRITEISISDNLGRIILTKSGAFDNETELDVSFMNPGVYMVRVISDGKTEYLKLQVIK